jgi:hypothetical protein
MISIDMTSQFTWGFPSKTQSLKYDISGKEIDPQEEKKQGGFSKGKLEGTKCKMKIYNTN